MYKTIWNIVDTTEHTTTVLTVYHFGKDPQILSHVFEEGHAYEVEMMWNFKLVPTIAMTFKCLTRFYIVK